MGRNGMFMRLTLLVAMAVLSPSGEDLLAAPTVPELQQGQQGTVEGTIVDAGTKTPLAGVQVFARGATNDTRTDAAGRYTLSNLPPGAVTISARIIGFRVTEQTVQVASGQRATANFEMELQILRLEEIVVTGTAGGTQMKAIGNAVSRIDAAELQIKSPANDLTQFLSSKATGMTMGAPHGMIGTGTAIQIRGVSSMALSSQPLLYVDGVRVNNDATVGPSLRGGQLASRMNDFNPEDIESIEIIKGPAAATLYGTEAAAGVIQIITKKGAQGAPSIELAVRSGFDFMQNPGGRFPVTYDLIEATGLMDSLNIYEEYEQRTGKPIFTKGLLQSYNGSIKGGTDLFRYYTSVDYHNDVGIVDYNWQKQFSTRANVSLHPTNVLDFSANLGFVRSNTRFAQAATGYGVWEAIAWTNPNTRNTTTQGFRYAPPEVMAQVDSRLRVNRFTGSFQMNHRPFSWLSQRATVGLDFGNDLSSQLFPKVKDGEPNFFSAAGVGQKRIDNDNNLFSSFDWGATAKFSLGAALSTATSIGAQYTQRQNESSFAFGSGFPVPSVTTVSGAAVTQAGESFTQNKTLGTYVQEQVTWRNNVFITAAVRADANSAFGAEFKAAYYPKLSATWVVSDESFWKFRFLPELRLRSAWGEAGMQPGVFDAVTLYAPITGPGNVSVLTPTTLGNPSLKPEVGQELEAGFDASVLGDRVSINYTHYDKRTKGALVAQRVKPSDGFPGTQLVNLGLVHNWGNELTLNASLLRLRSLGFDLGFNFATHENLILDMGGVAPQGGFGSRNVVGYPIGTFMAPLALSGSLVPGTTTPINMMCDGGTGPNGQDMGGAPVPCATAPGVSWGTSDPRWSGNVTVGVRLGQHLRLSALTEFKGGHQLNSNIAAFHRTMFSSLAVNPITDARMAAYITQLNTDVTGRYKAGFARVRELSAVFSFPPSLASAIGADQASLMLGWRNAFMIWQQQKEVWGVKVFDPEQSGTAFAPTSQIVATIRVTF